MADEEVKPRVFTRDEIRSAIFAEKKLATKQVKFFGMDIEIRQPVLATVLAVQNNEDRQSAVIDTLVKYAYVPGTNDKVFEEADTDSLLKLPFGKDFLRVSTALTEITDVDFLDTAKP